MTNKMILLCVSFMLLNVIDIIISYFGIFTIGLIEYNQMVLNNPFWLVSTLKVITMGFICYCVCIYSKKHIKYTMTFMTVATVFYAGIVVNNLYWIVRYL